MMTITDILERQVTANTSHEFCLDSQFGSLSSFVIKQEGSTANKELIYIFIRKNIKDIFTWFGSEINDDLINSMTKSMYSECYFLKISEFKLFIEKVKSGDYGKLFGKMTPAALFLYLKDFIAESFRIREDLKQRSHEKEKSQTKDIESSAFLEKYYGLKNDENKEDFDIELFQSELGKIKTTLEAKRHIKPELKFMTEDEFKEKQRKSLEEFREKFPDCFGCDLH